MLHTQQIPYEFCVLKKIGSFNQWTHENDGINSKFQTHQQNLIIFACFLSMLTACHGSKSKQF